MLSQFCVGNNNNSQRKVTLCHIMLCSLLKSTKKVARETMLRMLEKCGRYILLSLIDDEVVLG